MIGFPLPGTTPATTPDPAGAPLGDAAPAGLFAGLLAGLATTMDAGGTVRQVDGDGEAEGDAPSPDDDDGRNDTALALRTSLSGSFVARLDRTPVGRLDRTPVVGVPSPEASPSAAHDLPIDRPAAEPSQPIISTGETEGAGGAAEPPRDSGPIVALLVDGTEAPSAPIDGPIPPFSTIPAEVVGARPYTPTKAARGPDSAASPPVRDVGAQVPEPVAPPLAEEPAEPNSHTTGLNRPEGGDASSLGPVARVVSTPPSSVDSPQRPISPNLVDRVVRAVELQRTQPPPRAVAIELPELEGLRIIVSLRLDGTIHVAPVAASGVTSPATAFVDAVSDALVEQGFQLAGDTASDHRRERDPEPEASQTGPPGMRSRTRTRHTVNDLRL